VQQNSGKLPGSQPQFPRQSIDVSRLSPQGRPDRAGRFIESQGLLGLRRRQFSPAALGPQDSEKIGAFGDRVGSLLDQPGGAGAGRAVDAPRDGEDLAPLFQCQFGGDQRAAVERGLDDQGVAAQATDDPVAAGKVAGERLAPRQGLAEQGAACDDLVKKPGMFPGIDPINAAAEDGDRLAARCQDPTMRRPVDTPRQPADDRDPLTGHRVRQVSAAIRPVDDGAREPTTASASPKRRSPRP